LKNKIKSKIKENKILKNIKTGNKWIENRNIENKIFKKDCKKIDEIEIRFWENKRLEDNKIGK
jgi:hypothetical protein